MKMLRLVLVGLMAVLGLNALVTLPAQASAQSPCGFGQYLGGGDPAPAPGQPNFRGAILKPASSQVPAGVDANHDGWMCQTGIAAWVDDTSRVPTTRNGQRLVFGDIYRLPDSDPNVAGGDIDVQHHRFFANTLTDGSNQYVFRYVIYDSNDTFYLNGTRVTRKTFEHRVIDGFIFTAVYSTDRRSDSVFSIYTHEV